MFTVLAAAETGVVTENHYADPKMWAERYQEFSVGAIGTGVAIGDYDNDGRPDLHVVSKTESNRLFRNLGNWKFEDVTASAGVSGLPENWAGKVKGWFGWNGGSAVEAWKQGATFADVNNDGWLDLYVCRFNAPNLLYMNRGDGTFREEAEARGLALIDACGMAAFADFDRDGWLDVYIVTNLGDAAARPHGQPDRLFRNRGDGTFIDVSARAGIAGEAQGHSATWWDFNDDGWPDLYVANDFAAPDALYRNQRDGTFKDVATDVLPRVPYSSMGSDLGDVNNDGRIDFLAADMAATTAEKDLRGMADSRAQRTDEAAGGIAPYQFERSALFLNTDTERCAEAAFLAGLAATDWTWSVRFEDLDNDGWIDLHVTNGMVRELHNVDLLVRAMQAENPADRVRAMRDSPVLAERNLAFRNRGDLRFESTGAEWGLDQPGVSFGAAFGDLDGDGDLDLVFSNYESGVTVLRNDSADGHRATIALRGTISSRFGVGANVRIETASGTQVRQFVLARGYMSSSEPILHFGLGDETRIPRLTVRWPSGHVQEFRELPADRHFTITEPASTTVASVAEPGPTRTRPLFVDVSRATNLALVSREEILDEIQRQPMLPFRHNRCGPALAIGDLDGDEHDEICVGGTTRDPLQVLRLTELGQFSPWSRPSSPSGSVLNDGPVLIFDADGDGRNDMLVTKGSVARLAGDPAYRPELWLNRGADGFRAAAPDTLPVALQPIGAAASVDFDRDGRLDLFVGGRVVPGQYPRAPRSQLLKAQGDRFVDVTMAYAPALTEVGMVTSALWSDVDDDGWPDLLLALEWGGVRYWRNQRGRGFEDRSESAGFAAAGVGWWTSLAAADFNGDGRLDYVAGNAGLNTPYPASPERPAVLLYGDYRDNGRSLLIEGRYAGDRLVPWRSRREFVATMPSIRKRFPKNDDFARATVDEILGDRMRTTTLRLAVTELRSGVFFSQPDGRFEFQPLPRMAQIAPLQGIVAGDFDGDGHADIFAVQNSFASAPAVGRFDGGLSQLLRGDGRGNFEPVPPAESGLIVTGDARALVVLDSNHDAWPDFSLTRNHGVSAAYQHATIAGRRFLNVRLRGPAGNPTAAGARVMLEFASGRTQTSEVYAGSSAFSQSSASGFFGHPVDDPPRRLRVRWPDGEKTEHDVPPNATTLTLSPSDA